MCLAILPSGASSKSERDVSPETGESMKITSVDVTPVLLPQNDPYWLGDVRAVVARVNTDNGLQGVGYTMLSRLSGALFFKTLTTAVEELAGLVIGENPHEPERIHSKMIYPG